MRFRATIENVPTFHRIIQSIEKLQKKCIIKFSENELAIICNSDTNEGGIQVWSQIKVGALFTGYRIQSNAENTITVSLPADALLAALRPHQDTDIEEATVKLAKKHDVAVLSFEVTGASRSGARRRVTHDVRIEVMKPADVERLAEPMCPEPDVHIVLPSLQKLRTIVERMRPMADVLAVRANGAGRLTLSIATESVRLDTTWTTCTNPKMAGENASQLSQPAEEQRDPEQMATVLVSIRSFLKFLNSHVVSTTTIASICASHCLILYVYIGDVTDAGGVLTFYIPAIVNDEMLA